MSDTALAVVPDQISAATLETVLVGGDLKGLSPVQRVEYVSQVCRSLGLNPLTKPFDYITLNGKLTLYAKRDCTEQLRKLHGVSIKIVAREVVEGIYVVTAHAEDRSGRVDESIGAVPIDRLQGEAKANAIMKAETKSKRRVTLSICGLGMLDETEVDSVPGHRHEPEEPAPPAPNPRSDRIPDTTVRSIYGMARAMKWKMAALIACAREVLEAPSIKRIEDLTAHQGELLAAELETRQSQEASQ